MSCLRDQLNLNRRTRNAEHETRNTKHGTRNTERNQLFHQIFHTCNLTLFNLITCTIF
jgi:regulator of replication initiation timing